MVAFVSPRHCGHCVLQLGRSVFPDRWAPGRFDEADHAGLGLHVVRFMGKRLGWLDIGRMVGVEDVICMGVWCGGDQEVKMFEAEVVDWFPFVSLV